MVTIMALVWGGAALLVALAFRKEARKRKD
jgi:hypothetical protein